MTGGPGGNRQRAPGFRRVAAGPPAASAELGGRTWWPGPSLAGCLPSSSPRSACSPTGVRRRPPRVRLAERGVDARWATWDDPAVDWAAADLVAVRSTWDYHRRCAEFPAWARAVERDTVLLNGADVFTWNADKAYLVALDGRVPVVPTSRLSDPGLAAGLRSALDRFGAVVVKARTGASGVGSSWPSHRRPPPVRAHRRTPDRAAAGGVRAHARGDVGVRARRACGLPGRSCLRRGRSGARGVRRGVPAVPLGEEPARVAVEAMASVADLLGHRSTTAASTSCWSTTAACRRRGRADRARAVPRRVPR